MIKIALVALALFLVGCGETSTRVDTVFIDRNVTIIEYVDRNVTETVFVDSNNSEEPLMCVAETFETVFIGKIIYEDKTPYKRGAIRAEGSGWETFAITDDNGEFRIEVKGDSRFIFSAHSPFGDFIFYEFDSPLIIPKYDEGDAYICEYGEETLNCFQTEPIK